MNREVIIKGLKGVFYELEDHVIEQLLVFSENIKLKKGTEIIKQGEGHDFMYLIISGCVKSYYFNEGKEICTWFAFENGIATTINTFYGKISNETVVTLEDSHLVKINTKMFRYLESKEISVSHLVSNIIANHASFLEGNMYLRSLKSKDRYLTLLDEKSKNLDRIPLKDISSFLGIRKETLSRIRGGNYKVIDSKKTSHSNRNILFS